MFEFLLDPEIWASLLTLTLLEIVLGIDNIIFLSIVTSRLPEKQQPFARRLGLALALIGRIALLAALAWIIGLTKPLFDIGSYTASWRDIILIGGGLFLLYKATVEMHEMVEGREDHTGKKAPSAFFAVLVQILLLDLVFSLDSILTAIGMTDNLPVMITAITIAIGVMMFAAEPVSAFVQAHPTVKMLALAFLLLVGVALIADGAHFHIPRGYLYFAIAFSAGVEMLNLLMARRRSSGGGSGPR